MKTTIKFLAKGVKVNEVYTSVFYSFDSYDKTITIYGRDYEHLPKELGQIKNDSMMIEDYFENDRVLITPTNPLYNGALIAYKKARLADRKRYLKQLEKNAVKYSYMDYSKEIEETKKCIESLSA